LHALLLISQKINQITDIRVLLHEILNLAISNIGAERGLIILADESGEIYHTLASESLDNRDVTFSKSIVDKALKDNKTLISIDLRNDKRFKDSNSIEGLNILSFVCIPLSVPRQDHSLGTLYIDQRIHKKTFTNDDIAFLKTFASLAAIAISNTNFVERIKAELVQLREEVGKKYSLSGVIGQGAAMQKVFHTVRQIMNDDCTVLITGESGTGKEVIAKAMHYNGNRRNMPFMAINCGALPETLLEAELFGSQRGAFTGAIDKKGLLQSAQGGTVFLDEIHHTSEAMQVKLLRFLQNKEIRRVGGTKTVAIDVRLICATNENIQQLLDDGRFRKDFYYRINVVAIDIPPLRERREDIPILAQHFLDKYSKEKKKGLKGFDKKALDALIRYDWTANNVRELENEIERLAIFVPDNSMVRVDDLSERILSGVVRTSAIPSQGSVNQTQVLTYEAFEKNYIHAILTIVDGNKTKAAQIMGIPRSTLIGKMRKLNIL